MQAKPLVALAIIVIATIPVISAPAAAKESYYYARATGFSTSFYLIGGQYTLYLYAKRSVLGYVTPASKSCIFGGNLQRVWPTHDTLSLGSGVTISTIVPHKIGPETLNLPAGLYSIYVASLTDCDWHFSLESTSHNAAGLSPVQMLRVTKTGRQFSPSAAFNDQVQFYAQYRTENDVNASASGNVQIINKDKVVSTFPLVVGRDESSGANVFYVDIQFEESDKRYLGKNTAKFIVKIGATEFTSTGEFTLTQ